jgi:hypothetical protein
MTNLRILLLMMTQKHKCLSRCCCSYSTPSLPKFSRWSSTETYFHHGRYVRGKSVRMCSVSQITFLRIFLEQDGKTLWWDNRTVNRSAIRATGYFQSYPNRLRFSSLPCPQSPCHAVIDPVFQEGFFEVKTSFPTKPVSGRDGGVFRTTCGDFSRPVEELEYTCLLKNTFTEPSHDRGFKDTVVSGNLPWVSFVEKCISGGRLTSNVTWTPTFRKQQLARKGLSQRVQNHNQHRVVRIEPVFWQYRSRYNVTYFQQRMNRNKSVTHIPKSLCDKKSLFVEADESKQVCYTHPH